MMDYNPNNVVIDIPLCDILELIDNLKRKGFPFERSASSYVRVISVSDGSLEYRVGTVIPLN